MTTPARTGGPRPRGMIDNRIPSLDGLRALSVLFVIGAHASVTSGAPGVAKAAFASFNAGGLGVRIFFVISGFLITSLLLEEQRHEGKIALRRFYLRRTFRIFPPYYAYIAAIALCSYFQWIVLPRENILHAITYTINYAESGTWWLAHAWSLSVEEQFYLLWPFFIIALGVRRALVTAVVFMVAAPLLRLGLYVLLPDIRPGIGYRFETIADALAIGCALAMLRDRLWQSRRYRHLLQSRWFFLVPLIVALTVLLDGRPRITYLFGMTIKNLGIALMIDWCMRNPSGVVGRVLNARPVAFVGILSYSLYLWQQPFLNASFNSWATRWPQNLVLTAAAGLLSYYVIERPALRARRRVEQRLRAPQSTPSLGTATA